VAITRVHLEEDTARSVHQAGDYSLVDFNRAGVPLMELVTEPVIRSAEHASRFAKELQLLLRYLNVSDANMEKGEMRVEANISVSCEGGTLGTKVEVKNLNSFRVVERAIRYEVERQSALLEKGERVVQETRGWDENKQQTFSQRLKEESHDYRYFPEPDLPKLRVTLMPDFNSETLRKSLPELPEEKRKRYHESLGIKEEDIESYIGDSELDTFFSAVAALVGNDTVTLQRASNYITSDIVGLRGSAGHEVFTHMSPVQFCALMRLMDEAKLSSRGAKDVLKIMVLYGGEPEEIALREHLLQASDDGTLRTLVREVIDMHPNVVAEYTSGKESALQFLVGQGMKASKGAANPTILASFFREVLGS